MFRIGPRSLALVLSALVLASAVAPLATAGGPSPAGPGAVGTAAATSAVDASGAASPRSAVSGTDATDSILVRAELSLTPNRPGSVGVDQTFRLPDRVTAFSVGLPDGASVSASEGFSREGGEWTWDGETATPTLRYSLAANDTAPTAGPLETAGRYRFVDVGEWALVRRPPVALRWRQRGEAPLSVGREASVDGEGAVGDEMAFLGPHRVVTRRAHDQTFRLVVPAAADMAGSPAAILDSLARASGSLQVGDRDASVLAVAAPTGRVEWGARGLQTGDGDFWVRDVQTTDEVENVWVHEYVHTRQSFTTRESAAWVTEAVASWYAIKHGLETGATDFETFAEALAQGSRGPQSRSVLAAPSTWRNGAQYRKGALVTGELDRRIRLASDHGASLQAVLRRLNERTRPVSNDDFVDAVVAAGGSSVRAAATRYTETRAAPEMWSRAAHERAFGTDPALMRVAFDPASDVGVRGPYREGSLDRPLVLARGEALAVSVAVENVGGSPGGYAVDLRVGGETATSESGTLAAGESTSVTLTRAFESTGEYAVSVAGERFTVVVRDPATPRVTGLRVEPTTVEPGGSVTATATVTNPQRVPGNLTVEFTRDGETVTTRTVPVGPNATTTVAVSVSFSEAGTHRIAAGDARATVEVGADASGGGGFGDVGLGDDGGTGAPVPGLGIVPAVLALLVVGLLARRR